jgi:hypothetical protein
VDDAHSVDRVWQGDPFSTKDLVGNLQCMGASCRPDFLQPRCVCSRESSFSSLSGLADEDNLAKESKISQPLAVCSPLPACTMRRMREYGHESKLAGRVATVHKLGSSLARTTIRSQSLRRAVAAARRLRGTAAQQAR